MENMTSQGDSRAYEFDAFRLDLARGSVLRPDGTEARLRPKVFALLCFFLNNPGRLLGRRELLDALWPGVAVTDDSLTQCVGDLRHILGDRAIHVLRTVPKRGYILSAEVRRDDLPSLSACPRGHPTPAPSFTLVHDIAALRRETMAVHRFEALEGDQACLMLADGLANDLTFALTCLEGLRVLLATDLTVGEGYRVSPDYARRLTGMAQAVVRT